MKKIEEQNYSYYTAELQQALGSDVRFQVTSESGKSKWLNLNPESYRAFMDVFGKYYESEQDKNKTIIEIKEDMAIPNTDIVLEEGDKIEILKEAVRYDQADELVDMLGLQGAWDELVSAMSDSEFNENYEYIMRMHR